MQLAMMYIEAMAVVWVTTLGDFCNIAYVNAKFLQKNNQRDIILNNLFYQGRKTDDLSMNELHGKSKWVTDDSRYIWTIGHWYVPKFPAFYCMSIMLHNAPNIVSELFLTTPHSQSLKFTCVQHIITLAL